MTRTLLITGTSTGLGLSLAIQAAQRGYKVYATMRNLQKRQALDEAASAAGINLNVMRLDVEDTKTIDACISHIITEDGRIDAIVNNAGVGFVRSTEQATEEDMLWVMNVNLMGVIRCTKAVLPHMRQAKAGHIINISSVGGLVGQPFNEVYCASKFAVEGYSEALASYVGPAFGIHFTTVEPGGIQSEFANSALKHFADTGGMLDDPYRPILEKYMGGAQARAADPNSTPVYQTPGEVAEIILGCLNSDNPPIRLRTSEWAEDLCRLKTSADPDGKKLQDKVIKMFLT